MSNTSQPRGFLDQLESLLAHARGLELALEQERRKSRSLQEEINGAHAMFGRLMHEEKARAGELTVENGRIRSQMAQLEQSELAVKDRLKTVERERRQAMEELKRYQMAWSAVLERDREAKVVIEESRRAIARASELDKGRAALVQSLESEKAAREQIERHSQGYQSELQSALVRLHSSEVKFSEISKELQALREARKSVDEEIARIEKTMRERNELDLAREKENLRAEVENEARARAETAAEAKVQRLQQECERLRVELQGFRVALDAETARSERLEDALASAGSIAFDEPILAEDPGIQQTQGEC